MNRYDIMRNNGMRKWDGKKLYIIIDEIADLIDTCGKQIEKHIAKLARLGRGAGVHLIVATQHPTNQVLSRQITNNLETRICLQVNDKAASRLVISANGAEQLKGHGDALLRFCGKLTHFQGAYLDDEHLVAYSHSWKKEELSREVVIEPDPAIMRYAAQA